MVLVNVVVEEPIQVDAHDHDWDAVVDFQVILPLTLSQFDEVLVGIVGKAHDAEVVGRNGRIYFHYEWQRQNSPEIDQNSLLRRIQVSASEFSGNVEEKWEPIKKEKYIRCDCGEKECQNSVHINHDGEGMIAIESWHLGYISCQLPENVALCELVE
jgi:hypothetical protein